MYCEQCGEELSNDAEYCSACGSPVHLESPPDNSSATPTTSIHFLNEFEIGPDETIYLKKRATRAGDWIVPSGRLYVTNQRLVFKPRFYYFTKDTVGVPLREISYVGVKPRGVGKLSEGGLRNRLQIVTRAGEEELFAVYNLNDTVDRIEQIISDFDTATTCT